MTTTQRVLKRFVNDEEGATMVEYGFMVALIAVVVVVAVGPLGLAIQAFFTTVPALL